MHRPSHSPRRRFVDPTVGLFVSLYLILVAFFIVMNEVSNQETARAVAAMESLDDAFERPYPVPALTPGLAPPASHPTGDEAFLVEAGELVASILGPPENVGAEGGNRRILELDTHALFFDDAPRLSAQAQRFFDALADVLAEAPAGIRREAVFLFGRAGDEGGFAVARADRLARAMAEAGAPPAAIGVGLAPELTGRELRIELRSAALARAQVRLAGSEFGGRQ